MTSQELLKSDVLDILFENRNKNYGAYVLRKFYHVRLSEALLSATAGILLITYLCKPQYENYFSPGGILYPDSVVLHTVHVPDTKLPKNRSSTKPATSLAQISYTNVRISDHAKTTDVPEQGNLGKAILSNITRDGTPSDDLPLPAAAPEIPLEKPAAPQPFVPSYAAPEFPGGLAAWSQFLNSFLQAPESLGPGEKKSVVVKFFISKEGSISGFEVVQSAGAQFDQEVIRVLKKMPKWKPALQNGQPVATTFTQPVTFIGLEE